jgi:quercetin dioxygenase-like cupin family protein
MSTIITPEKQLGLSPRGPTFTGAVAAYGVMPATDGISITSVTFPPGARTFWHSHERGQILQVVCGLGLFQTEGKPVQYLRAGDTVYIPKDERHWHGATPETTMTHTAISMGVTKWEDEVSAADYKKP